MPIRRRANKRPGSAVPLASPGASRSVCPGDPATPNMSDSRVAGAGGFNMTPKVSLAAPLPRVSAAITENGARQARPVHGEFGVHDAARRGQAHGRTRNRIEISAVGVGIHVRRRAHAEIRRRPLDSASARCASNSGPRYRPLKRGEPREKKCRWIRSRRSGSGRTRSQRSGR